MISVGWVLPCNYFFREVGFTDPFSPIELAVRGNHYRPKFLVAHCDSVCQLWFGARIAAGYGMDNQQSSRT